MKNLNTIGLVLLMLTLVGCIEEPVREDVPELITKVTLTFTPVGGGSDVVISAIDPDGEGVKNITAEGAIILQQTTFYTLKLTLFNELADMTSPSYNITEEIEAEGDEHLFFFSWTNNLFNAPAGDGNIDNRADNVDYQDTDGKNPIGLTTRWQAVSATKSGLFRILLKHQPGLKSATSSSTQGETDLDLTFGLQVN